jgi:nucleotide-binding universal stress UspA family protein
MIKTILVPSSGTHTDVSVFATALAVARPLNAHLEFFHVRFTVYEAAARSAPVPFCRGAALTDALDLLSEQDETLSANGKKQFEEFCRTNEIAIRSTPTGVQQVSASWAEETDCPEKRLLFHARYSDLMVVGRAHNNTDRMPNNLIEMLLLNCGCPIVIAADSPKTSLGGTIVVGWKETLEAVRALTAAIPLLQRARRVVLVNIAEGDARPGILEAAARRLAWHGIVAETRLIGDKSRPAEVHLPELAAELRADLLAVGGYGHSPLREGVFGGVTRTLIDHAELPVFMLH